MKNPIDLRQDRRQWLKTSATIVGASLLPAPQLAAEALQEEKKATGTATTERNAAGHFFTPGQHATVEELTETILPADSHSGGAKAAKVADYIDLTLRNSTDDTRKALWREGLRLIDSMSQHYFGQPFAAVTPEQRIEMLTVLSENSQRKELPEVRLFNDLKEMTIFGYYTSKIGIHDELGYKGNRILKEYVGCDDQHLADT